MAYDDLHLEASLGLPPEPGSARRARQFIRDFCLAAALDDDVCEKAALLVSELVTNAVIHGRTRATLTAQRPDGCLRVAVHDLNAQLPGMPPTDADAESGRGIRIVAAVADRWGAEPDGHGKTVWFELAL